MIDFSYTLNLHHLELFQAVVQEGNVSRAAFRLGISQPSVSSQLKELEDRLGLSLLERLPRGVRPTEAGEALSAHARDLFAVRDRAAQAMLERRNLSSGRLVVGASRTVGTQILPALLREFRDRHPRIALAAEIGNTHDVEEWIRENRVDIGLVEGEVAAEFSQGSFAEDELVPVISPMLLSGQKTPGTLKEFCRHPLVLREPGSGTRALVEEILKRAGIPCKAAFSFDTAEAVRAFAEAGFGAAFLPRALVADPVSKGTLLEARFQEKRLKRSFRWILHPDRPISPATRAFHQGILAGRTSKVAGRRTRPNKATLRS